MNKDEITLQIQKFKARRLKTHLANYGTTVSIFLGLSIFANGISLSSFYSFLMFAPVLSYFMIQSLKFARKSYKIKLKLKELETTKYNLSPSFSFFKFLSQPSFAFRLSLILFFLIFITTFARIRTPEPKLSYQITTNK